jgi:hypothetical protein
VLNRSNFEQEETEKAERFIDGCIDNEPLGAMATALSGHACVGLPCPRKAVGMAPPMRLRLNIPAEINSTLMPLFPPVPTILFY